MVDEMIKFPKESYLINIGTNKFDVKPLEEICVSLLNSIYLFGGNIRPFPNSETPTSIFVDYKPSNFKTLDVYNYQVVDVEMEMQLNLLENQKNFPDRLRKFIEDCSRTMKNELPEKSSGDRKEWIQVVNVYKY